MKIFLSLKIMNLLENFRALENTNIKGTRLRHLRINISQSV
jgi:hypothetical protein